MGRTRRRTYSVASAILLLSGDDSTTALSSVEGRLAADNSLARTGTTAVDVLADLDSVGIPGRHFDGVYVVVDGSGCDGRCASCRNRNWSRDITKYARVERGLLTMVGWLLRLRNIKLPGGERLEWIQRIQGPICPT